MKLPVAAIQMRPKLGRVERNLARAGSLAAEAAAAGAKLIVLPEFFSTGMGYDPALEPAALPPDGAAVALLTDLASEHGALVAGSFLCAVSPGSTRNRFVLAGPAGPLGHHDKDLPTMWENCYYEPGTDDGAIRAGGLTVGVVLCWEMMRGQTARRLAGRVDLLIGGSAWWSAPHWSPRHFWRQLGARNAANAAEAPAMMASLLGVPYIHAALAGPLRCSTPGLPLSYVGRFEGGAVICDADGTELARSANRDDDSVVLAEVEVQA